MSIESKLLISILKMTKTGIGSLKDVNSDARIPTSASSVLLEKLQTESLLIQNGDEIAVSVESRLTMAFKAVTLGLDLQRVSDFLSWQEFEEIAALGLAQYGYETSKNVHFKHAGRRWEIDVVGCKKPLIICIDCKQWHHGMNSATVNKMADSQSRRVKAFADSLPYSKTKICCTKWETAEFVPVILSLIPVNFKFSDGVPIVPALQFRDFIDQLPVNLESLKVFYKKWSHL
jgi:hypothetical protein